MYVNKFVEDDRVMIIKTQICQKRSGKPTTNKPRRQQPTFHQEARTPRRRPWSARRNAWRRPLHTFLWCYALKVVGPQHQLYESPLHSPEWDRLWNHTSCHYGSQNPELRGKLIRPWLCCSTISVFMIRLSKILICLILSQDSLSVQPVREGCASMLFPWKRRKSQHLSRIFGLHCVWWQVHHASLADGSLRVYPDKGNIYRYIYGLNW